MKLKKTVPLLTVIIFSIVFVSTLSSCKKTESEVIFAMDTFMTVEIAGSKNDIEEIKKIIEETERRLSVTLHSSDIYKLNEFKSFEFNDEYFNLVVRCLQFSSLSNGFFDITVFPLVKEWGFIDKSHRVPTENELAECLSKVGYEKIRLNEKTVSLSDNAEIDLGGIAKGYLSDKIVSFLKSRGIKSGVLNLGGNVYIHGLKDNGEVRKVGIAHPNENDCFGFLTVCDKAVITSGQYQRYFIENGKQYGHIIDPHTGLPVDNDFRSVTVIGEDGTMCDAMSTAIFAMGERAFPFITENRLSCVILTENSVYVTNDIENDFVLSQTYSDLALKVIQ